MTAREKEEHYGQVAITPHPAWAQRFWNDLAPVKDRIATHALFREMADGELSLARFRHALLNFYPLVGNFPHYMALTLARTQEVSRPGMLATRDWLINNIRIEQRHLYWYRDWAMGFGISPAALDAVTPPPAMDAVNHFLWHVNQRGSIAESLAATNLAIEWATGDWTQSVVKGMRLYAERGVARIDRRSMAWLRAHAHYDDAHPHEAMELVKQLCDNDPELQARAFAAARRGMEYYLLALDDCYASGNG
ncbi:MAG: pyrroloquinoline quinone biosynthesis protein [Moraxellaceae bacterium]|jgi:pyrroloquinoline quinone (PQQ) biosynthesis protein C|nr:pyrroloquinoline quinone biosynthesis protein [Moraxellaceae bacterium]